MKGRGGKDEHTLNGTSTDRLQKHIQKLANAAQVSFAELALLWDQNQLVRRLTRSVVLGTAKVMRFEDIDEARTETKPWAGVSERAQKIVVTTSHLRQVHVFLKVLQYAADHSVLRQSLHQVILFIFHFPIIHLQALLKFAFKHS